jgi:hypothetical protein
MTSILDGEMAAVLAGALIGANVPFGITIMRTTNAVDPDAPWEPGTTTDTVYDAQGWEENYSTQDIDGTLIKAADVRVVVLLSTIAKAAGAPGSSPSTIVPATGDLVTSRGKSYLVIAAAEDPTGSIARLQVRA